MKRKIFSLLLALIMVLTLLPVAGASAKQEKKVGSTSDQAISVYAEASESSTVVGTLNKSDTFLLLGQTDVGTDTWYKVQYSASVTGYILKQDGVTVTTESIPELVATGGTFEHDGTVRKVVAEVKDGEGYTIQYSTDNGATWSATVPSLTAVGKLTVKVKAVKSGSADLTCADVVLEVKAKTVTETWATVVNCTDSVNVRAGAGSNTAKLGTAKKGAKFKVLAVEGQWYKVQYTSTKVGYIHSDYISVKTETYTEDTPVETPAGDNQIATVVNCTSNVNARSGAGTKYGLLGTAKKGAQYKLLATVKVGTATWYKVQYTSDKVAYIHGDYIKVTTGTTPDPAPSGQTVTIVNCNESVNVRAGAGSDTTKLGTAKKGATYTYLGISGDGKWYQIQYTATQKGYVFKDYVKLSSGGGTPDPTPTGKTATIVNCDSFVNVRESYSSSSKLLGTAKKGATYTVVGQNGSWVQVQYTTTQKGYIFSKYVKISSTSDGGTTPTETAATGYGYVVNCTTNVNVRSGAGTSHGIVGTANKSQVYQILAKSGDWYKIQYKTDTVGYIYASYFSKATNDTTQKATVVNCTTSVNVRSAANTSSDLLGTAKLGATFIFLKIMDNYAMVIYNGRVGCIHKNYIKVG